MIIEKAFPFRLVYKLVFARRAGGQAVAGSAGGQAVTGLVCCRSAFGYRSVSAAAPQARRAQDMCSRSFPDPLGIAVWFDKLEFGGFAELTIDS